MLQTDPLGAGSARPPATSAAAPVALLAALGEVLAAAPLLAPRMPAIGPVHGADVGTGPAGCRTRPAPLPADPAETGPPWPRCQPYCSRPRDKLARYPQQPCLINFYAARDQNGPAPGTARQDFDAPVLSLLAGRRLCSASAAPSAAIRARLLRLTSGDRLRQLHTLSTTSTRYVALAGRGWAVRSDDQRGDAAVRVAAVTFLTRGQR